MYKWVTGYINENQEKWDSEKKEYEKRVQNEQQD